MLDLAAVAEEADVAEVKEFRFTFPGYQKILARPHGEEKGPRG